MLDCARKNVADKLCPIFCRLRTKLCLNFGRSHAKLCPISFAPCPFPNLAGPLQSNISLCGTHLELVEEAVSSRLALHVHVVLAQNMSHHLPHDTQYRVAQHIRLQHKVTQTPNIYFRDLVSRTSVENLGIRAGLMMQKLKFVFKQSSINNDGNVCHCRTAIRSIKLSVVDMVMMSNSPYPVMLGHVNELQHVRRFKKKCINYIFQN